MRDLFSLPSKFNFRWKYLHTKFSLFLLKDYFFPISELFSLKYLQNTEHILSVTDVSFKMSDSIFSDNVKLYYEISLILFIFQNYFFNLPISLNTPGKNMSASAEMMNSPWDQRRFLQNWKCLLQLQQVIQKPPTPEVQIMRNKQDPH